MSNPAPVRLHRSRAKGARLVSPNGLPIVCVTRPGKWGNPFKVGQRLPIDGVPHLVDSPAAAVRLFRMWLDVGPAGREVAGEARVELRGKNLACYCKDGPCHADVLLELANGKAALAPASPAAGKERAK